MSERQKLWEISGELEILAEGIAENGGELTPEIEERLDALEGALEEKVERIALLIRTHEVQADAAKAEEDRLRAIRKSHQNTVDGLKSYLHMHLARVGRSKVETPKARVRIQANSRPAIRWTGEEDAIPEPFRRVRISADTSRAYEEWKAGAELPEGFRVEEGSHVRIY